MAGIKKVEDTIIKDVAEAKKVVAKVVKEVEKVAVETVKTVEKVAKKVEVDIEDVVAFEKKVAEVLKNNLSAADGFFDKINIWFKNLTIKKIVRTFALIEQDALKAGAVVVNGAKVEVKDMKSLLTKFENKAIKFEKVAVADAEAIKKDWDEAIDELRKNS